MTTIPCATSTSAPASEFHLSPEQILQFHTDGYLAPLKACTPEEMATYREHIERMLLIPFVDLRGEEGKDPRNLWGIDKMKLEQPTWGHNRHLDDRTCWEVCTLPGIVGAMQSVMGEDLMLWRTNFFIKNPGGAEIPWHQDRNYWPLEPEIVVSAWMAIDPATVENSCLQILPGSHRKVIPHVKAKDEMAFQQMADLHGLDMNKKVDVELKPGEFILFNERTLHHSEVNHSNLRRIGLAIRVILPQVRVLKFDSPSHKVIQVSGSDRFGFNARTEPPLTDAQP